MTRKTAARIERQNNRAQTLIEFSVLSVQKEKVLYRDFVKTRETRKGVQMGLWDLMKSGVIRDKVKAPGVSNVRATVHVFGYKMA